MGLADMAMQLVHGIWFYLVSVLDMVSSYNKLLLDPKVMDCPTFI